jgi:hypothetical protein
MLERAIQCDPDYADAYYNAADLLDLCGRASQARLMWLRYLRLESDGEHARFARSRCGGPIGEVASATSSATDASS